MGIEEVLLLQKRRQKALELKNTINNSKINLKRGNKK